MELTVPTGPFAFDEPAYLFLDHRDGMVSVGCTRYHVAIDAWGMVDIWELPDQVDEAGLASSLQPGGALADILGNRLDPDPGALPGYMDVAAALEDLPRRCTDGQ